MFLGHDTELNLQAAVDLVNIAERSDPSTELAQINAWRIKYHCTAEPDDLRRIQPLLRELLTASLERVATLVNDILADAHVVPQLVRHDDNGWHLHAIPGDERPMRRIVVRTAVALADLVCGGEIARLAVCADTACTCLLIDLSRNRSRRFCGTNCSNRNAVAAYRMRKRKA
jgi:predicted RNA-binding Zn ribbon-like protein